MTREEWNTLCETAPVLLDGAWGTELQARGLAPGEGSDVWNRSHPDAVREVARSYVEAGSRIILTNTFGASRIMLDGHGLAAQTEELNRTGAALSKQAAGDQALVFGSIGPCGKMVMMGDVEEDDARAAFTEQAHALKEGGADGLVIETMADLKEVTLAVKAALTTGLPVLASMVYDTGPDKDRTMMGVTPEQAAEALEAAGAWAIGANCGQGPDGFLSICKRYRQATSLPIWMKPNAGLPEIEHGQAVYRMTPDNFADAVLRVRDAGATFMGGCCGTNPSFIAALRSRLS